MRAAFKTLLGMVLTVGCFSAFAAGEGIRITSYTVSKKQVLVQFASDEILRVGSILTAGDGCKLKVVKIRSQKAIATSEDCEAKRLIKKGKIVKIYDYSLEEQKPVVQVIQPLPVVEKPSDHVLKGLELSTFVFADSTMEIEGSDMDGSLTTGPSFGVSARYVDIKNNNLGIIAGVSYGFGQSFKQAEYFSDGGIEHDRSDLPQDDQGSFSYALPEVNVAVGFAERVYVYGGPNFSVPFSKGLPGVQFNGDVGFQVGAGVRIVEGFSAEISFRSLNYTMELKDDDKLFLPQNLDFENASQKGVLGRLSYTF